MKRSPFTGIVHTIWSFEPLLMLFVHSSDLDVGCEILQSVNKIITFPLTSLKQNNHTQNISLRSQDFSFLCVISNTKEGDWDYTRATKIQADIKYCTGLHCLFWGATSCRIERSLMALSCGVGGQICWLGEEREKRRGRRDDKEGDTEEQASHTQKMIAQESEIHNEKLWIHFELEEEMERCLADICTRFPAKFTETLLGHHGDTWVCQSCMSSFQLTSVIYKEGMCLCICLFVFRGIYYLLPTRLSGVCWR